MEDYLEPYKTMKMSSLTRLSLSSHPFYELSIVNTFEPFKKKFFVKLIILTHFNLEYYSISYKFHHLFMFEKKVNNYFAQRSCAKQKQKKNCCLKKSKMHLVIYKICLLFLEHTFCFSYFPSFLSHIPSLRYILIKVLLDFREQ